MKLEFLPIKTRIVYPPKDEIWDILDGLKLCEGDIIFITSKILAIHQGRTVEVGKADKEELIKQEASHWLRYQNRGGFFANLTIKDNILIPNAGIDESNANNHYILWPKEIDKLCREIRARLTQKHNLKNLGVVATDSALTPMRWGVTAIAIGLSGVQPLKNLRGKRDIFGREMRIAQVNTIDPLAAAAGLLMGEGKERIPIVILRGYKGIKFSRRGNMSGFSIPPETDLYQPLLEVMQKNSEK